MLIKRMVLGLSLALAVTFLVQAPANASIKCNEYQRYDTVKHDDGSFSNSEWRLKYVVGFRWCHNSANGNKWVKPLYSIGVYDRQGSSMSCNTVTGTNVLLYVGYNPYMWAYNGVNFNPGEFRVNCDPSTHNLDFQRYDNAPRLYKAGAVFPKWKANWRLEKAGVLFQGSGTLSGQFRPCNGVRLCGQ